MRGIKAVVFDVDGTLVALSRGIGDLYSEALRSCGVHLSPEVLQARIYSAWRNFEGDYLNVRWDFATNPAREMLLWHEFVRRVLEDCQPGLGSRGDLISSVYSFFAAGSSRSVMPGALEACRGLRDKGLLVVAASNNDARTRQVLNELGFGSSLSLVVTAGDLGWKKPSPRFFEAVSQRIAVSPDKMLHVGNCARLDVAAARQVGMNALLFEPGKPTSEGVIGELSGLEALLESWPFEP